MTVMLRRGWPTWPITSAAPTDPRPPAANTRPSAGGAAVQVVLDHVGEQHLDRPQEQPGRRSRPTPACPTATRCPARTGTPGACRPITEWRPLARDRRARIASTTPPTARTTRRRRANAVPTPSPATIQPPSAGPASRNAIGRTSWSSELAWASSRLRQQVGHDGVERRAEERGAGAVEGHQHQHVPQLERAGQRQHRHHPDGQPAHDVGRDQHPAAVEAVGDHAAEQQQHDRRHGHRDAHHRERGGRVRDRVHLPRHRDQEHAVADQRDGLPAPQQREVAVAQRAPAGLHG